MKKLRKIFIVIIIVILGGIVTTYIHKPKSIDKNTEAVMVDKDTTGIDNSKDVAALDEKLTFSVLGDVHGNIDSFQEAIKDFYTINPHMDAIVLNGDTVDQGKEESYASIKDSLNKNKKLLPKTIIKNIGNHEFYNYEAGTNSPEQVQTFINRYLEFSGEEKVYHDTWLKDYHFISLGSEDGNSKTNDAVRAFISDDQQKWLKEKLAEKYQKGKPIFVFLHQHLNSENKGWIGVEQSKQVRAILSKYPEVILFTSHTHSDLNDSSVLLHQPYTMIHTGAVTYTIIPDENSKGGMRREPYIKGLYIEVDGNNVVVKGRDLKEKQWIFTKEINN
jgi:3',5'-cyclic AMP phosphodiesterase CpdA